MKIPKLKRKSKAAPEGSDPVLQKCFLCEKEIDGEILMNVSKDKDMPICSECKKSFNNPVQMMCAIINKAYDNKNKEKTNET